MEKNDGKGVRDGNMDVRRPHGHIPSLQALFGDQFGFFCKLPVEDTKLPVESTKTSLSLF